MQLIQQTEKQHCCQKALNKVLALSHKWNEIHKSSLYILNYHTTLCF